MHRSQIRELTVDNAKKTLHTKQQRYLGEGFSIIFNNRPARYQWVNYSTASQLNYVPEVKGEEGEEEQKGGEEGDTQCICKINTEQKAS